MTYNLFLIILQSLVQVPALRQESENGNLTVRWLAVQLCRAAPKVWILSTTMSRELVPSLSPLTQLLPPLMLLLLLGHVGLFSRLLHTEARLMQVVVGL